MSRFYLIFIIMLLFCPIVFAKTSTLELEKIPCLEDLFNLEISVASKTNENILRAPGILTVITGQDIATSGARDLIDVLTMVPGINFGMDNMGVTGISMRGNWAHEGKVLMLIDGQDMNEELFSNIAFGHHFPVDLIDRIEIIRGPGSAIYGGYAELGVINIITKFSEKNEPDFFVSGSAGTLKSANFSAFAGETKDTFSYSASIFAGQGIRSNRDYTDFYGGSYDMTKDSKMSTLFLNGGMKIRDLSFRAIVDRHVVNQRDAYYIIVPDSIKNNFNGDFFELKYTYKISDKLTLTPLFKYKKQTSWSNDSERVKT